MIQGAKVKRHGYRNESKNMTKIDKVHLAPKHATRENSSCLVPSNQHKDSKHAVKLIR